MTTNKSSKQEQEFGVLLVEVTFNDFKVFKGAAAKAMQQFLPALAGGAPRQAGCGTGEGNLRPLRGDLIKKLTKIKKPR